MYSVFISLIFKASHPRFIYNMHMGCFSSSGPKSEFFLNVKCLLTCQWRLVFWDHTVLTVRLSKSLELETLATSLGHSNYRLQGFMHIHSDGGSCLSWICTKYKSHVKPCSTGVCLFIWNESSVLQVMQIWFALVLFKPKKNKSVVQ